MVDGYNTHLHQLIPNSFRPRVENPRGAARSHRGREPGRGPPAKQINGCGKIGPVHDTKRDCPYDCFVTTSGGVPLATQKTAQSPLANMQMAQDGCPQTLHHSILPK